MSHLILAFLLLPLAVALTPNDLHALDASKDGIKYTAATLGKSHAATGKTVVPSVPMPALSKDVLWESIASLSEAAQAWMGQKPMTSITATKGRAASKGLATPNRAAMNKSSKKIFFISMSKSGTSSFADFAYHSLNLTVMHDIGTVMVLDGMSRFDVDLPCPSFVNRKFAAEQSLPNYDKFTELMNLTALDLMTGTGSTINAFADDPFDSFFERFEQNIPDAKFVIWQRDATDWIESALRYFCPPPGDCKNDGVPFSIQADAEKYLGVELMDKMYGLDENGCLPHNVSCFSRMTYVLNYGTCSFGAPYTRESAPRGYQAHYGDVLSYFGSNGERWKKLLQLDFINDDLAGKKLCEFVYDDEPERCAGLTLVPNVEREQLADNMLVEAYNAALDSLSMDVVPLSAGLPFTSLLPGARCALPKAVTGLIPDAAHLKSYVEQSRVHGGYFAPK